jgi:tetratricopeptide (TPR) repeat protein
VANVLNSLAGIHADLGDYDEAERLFGRSVALLRSGARGRKVDVVRLHGALGLARVYRAQARCDQAGSLLRRTLVAAERAFGPRHPEVASVLNELGMLCKYTARFSEAGRLYQRALAITEHAFGPNDPRVAALYHNLGGLEHAGGNYPRGEPFARRALRIRESTLGRDHPEVAADASALAALLDAQGKYPEAERLYRRALAIFERTYGPSHPEIAVNLNNLAALRHAQGKAAEAYRLYRRALAIKEKTFGGDHPDVATTLNNLAVQRKSVGDLPAARRLYARALDIFERTLGPSHPHVLAVLENYAALLRRMRRGADAEALEARADRIRKGLDTVSAHDVVATATINPEFACFRLTVRPSKIHRWGVYAEERIPAGRKVIEYTGQRVSRVEAKRRWESHPLDFLFTLDSYWCVDGAAGGSGAEYINHSCDPNLQARIIRGHVLYMSKRRIATGEELTVDYRFSAAVAKIPCTCGSAKCRGFINLK